MDNKENNAALNSGLPFEKPSFIRKVAYSLGDIGSCFVWIFASSFLTLYYTDSVGISAAFVGTMMLAARLLDGVSDILMGVLIEKTNTRWGKARPWLFIGSIPLSLSLVLLFSVPEGFSAAEKNVYAFITYCFMAVVCYTMVNLSFHSILPRFSPDQLDRTVVRTITSFLTCILMLFISFATPKMLVSLGGQNSQKAWSTIAILYAVLALICLMICFFGAKENIPPSIANNEISEKTPIIPTLKILFKNKYFYLALIVMVSMYIYNGCFSGGLVYYATCVLGDISKYSILNTLMLIPMFFPVAPLIIKRFGRQRSVVTGLCICVVMGVINIIFSSSLGVTGANILIRSIGMIPFSAVLFTLSADIVEYVEAHHGMRAEGLITSINSFGMKVGTGLGSAILGWALALGKYDASLEVQSIAAINSIKTVTIIIPTICMLVMLIAMLNWDIDKK